MKRRGEGGGRPDDLGKGGLRQVDLAIGSGIDRFDLGRGGQKVPMTRIRNSIGIERCERCCLRCCEIQEEKLDKPIMFALCAFISYPSPPPHLWVLPQEAEVVPRDINNLHLIRHLRPAHTMRPGGEPRVGERGRVWWKASQAGSGRGQVIP